MLSSSSAASVEAKSWRPRRFSAPLFTCPRSSCENGNATDRSPVLPSLLLSYELKTALQHANNVFTSSYRDAKQVHAKALRSHCPLLIVNAADNTLHFHCQQRAPLLEASLVTDLYELLKVICHLPPALLVASSTSASQVTCPHTANVDKLSQEAVCPSHAAPLLPSSDHLDADRIQHLCASVTQATTQLQTQLASAKSLQLLRERRPHIGDAIDTVLCQTLEVAQQLSETLGNTVAADGAAQQLLREYGVRIRQPVDLLIEESTRSLSERLSEILANIADIANARHLSVSELQIVVCGPHMPQKHNSIVQFFLAFLRSDMGEGHNVYYLTNQYDYDAAVELISTHAIDSQLGDTLWEDPYRMHSDLLGPAMEKVLREIPEEKDA
ncbi:hypothetical protein RI367_008263 [Sorochytrium milnesiophthora]